MDTEVSRQRSTLRRIARRAMIERGLLPDFSHAALAELDDIRPTAAGSSGWPRDMRNLPWASIDNDDSRDLDQLTVAEIFPMLPEKLSTDLTSLGCQEDRLAIVIDMVFGEDGSIRSSDLYGATVRNRAKLATTALRPGWKAKDLLRARSQSSRGSPRTCASRTV